ncbi:MAG: ketol-acid reductoisomerase, chloroplastic-like [Candidatus Taylorbacteria bacterium]|nr:ketol-acid reductoisomerase, chloroplastic-like [Candidatus Taylorbacteria bacterium]
MKTATQFQSSVFAIGQLNLSTGCEQIVVGGRDRFKLLPAAFDNSNVQKIAFIGWGKQAPAQACNLRDSLLECGSKVIVSVGLRSNSPSRADAREKGFTEASGTLGDIETVVSDADLVILLIEDRAQVSRWKQIIGYMKPCATLGLSHGFLIGRLQSIGEVLRDDINVIMVAPKGVGSSVRDLYLKGRDTNGAGINASVAIFQDVTGNALDVALAWSIGIGSPMTFFTTMIHEVISDLTGERAGLLAGPWGLTEARYKALRAVDIAPIPSFLQSAKGLTGIVTKLISEYGLLGFYENLETQFQPAFERGYIQAYAGSKRLVEKIYEHVESGQEISDVILATDALETTPMSQVDKGEMWTVAREEGLYGQDVPMTERLAYTAGMYIAMLMAGIEVLIAKGHSGSEAINEQLIEGIDSLNQLMDRSGIANMVDSCSKTARIGTRTWGPEYEEMFTKAHGIPTEGNEGIFQNFLRSPFHEDIEECYKLRPSVRLVQ